MPDLESKIEDRLEELIKMNPADMSDQELETFLRHIRHTGMKRQAARRERTPRGSAKTVRENVAVRKLRMRLEAKGTTGAKIEQAITILKQTLGIK